MIEINTFLKYIHGGEEMHTQKLCLSTNEQFGIPVSNQIELFGDSGFDAFFTEWEPDCPVDQWAKLGKKRNMSYHSIHAPFGRAADMWSEDAEAGKAAYQELISCLSDCERNGVPIMIVHAYIGFDSADQPTQIGLQRFEALVAKAESAGVKIAFENTEGEAFLAALLQHFRGNQMVGFCWDTGHEMCYNHSQDLLALYGEQLICTHLNDNLGIKDPDGKITFLDDLHLLPFDGIADWENIALRLDQWGFDGMMTFELNTLSKPGRHENDKYAGMPLDQYIEECYKRACRVAALRK